MWLDNVLSVFSVDLSGLCGEFFLFLANIAPNAILENRDVEEGFR
jgi:hypothetical protein